MRFREICKAFTFISLSISMAFAQGPADIQSRTTLDEQFRPFYHGVASGDPDTNAVVIWTRVTPDGSGPVDVHWVFTEDLDLLTVVDSGTVTTYDSLDYTVKIIVDELEPDTWYYYRFHIGDRKSLIGRTRTSPSGDNDSLRFAVVSCSNYPAGFFNAYNSIAEREDIDAVIHLGDYIYEGEGTGSLGRPHEPNAEIIELEDYRQRYSQYRLDADLRRLHQLYPWMIVWDDHESADNSWKDGASNHDPVSEGSWADRKVNSITAWEEWMPAIKPDTADFNRIYRKIPFGDLLDIYMLDTRIAGRDSQVTGSAIDDPSRELLGGHQLAWLSSEMDSSSAQWQLLAQQVMMAPLEAPFVGPLNFDQWDGYRAERRRLYDTILTKSIDNVIVITGDIHTAWANDLPDTSYDASTGANSVGIEFVATSVTSPNGGVTIGEPLILGTNEHIKYVDLANHGYFILDINKTRAQGNFYHVSTVDDPSFSTSYDEGWYSNDGDNHLTAATSESPGHADLPDAPPALPDNPVSIAEDRPGMALIGAYPNPFQDRFMLKLGLFSGNTVSISILNLNGQVIMEKEVHGLNPGLNYIGMNGELLTPGAYIVKVKVDDQTVSRKIMKY